MDVEKTIREYLASVLHMSLATCVDNKPWVCEVHFVFDDNLNLYFRSKAARRHSVEIAQNPNVAGNVVEQHTIDQKPRGAYFEGVASVLESEAERAKVYPLFRDRLNCGPEILDDAKQEDGHNFYKVTVLDWYLFDSRESSPSQKYHLSQ
jgi:nitroimidazol reductase NimA-like FMN-containing flavoprotein (pyridoxamine 5'-phosphate oxidase superfamily)